METSEQSLVPPNVYQVHRNIPAQLDLPVPVKDRCSATESLMNCKIISNECKVRSRKGTVESTSQTIELKSNIPFNGLLSTSTNRPESSSIVIGEHVEDCVMVELHGNVIKEDTSVQDQPGPYLIDEQVLVQVSNEEQRVQAQTSRSADVVSVYVKSMGADDKGSLEMLSSRSSSIEHPNTRSSVHVKPGLLESRFVFPELSKDEYPTISLPQGPQKENLDMQLEKEEDKLQMPMRKSAKKAKLKLKSLQEDYNVIQKINYLKKRKHYPLSPTDKGKAINNLEMEVPMADIPIWARYLTSVRIIDGNLIYGIASSKAILHQTLEGHSRSILCDYIKSHPCNFENRRNARSQECRVMWQHKRVKFDGVPFTIVTSDDLKCSFGMNYKLKRKKTDKAPDLAVNEEFGSEEDEEKPGEMSDDVKEKNKATKVTVTPKKTYKDVMFTSCPAKITVKVIVKYPGYAVHPLSFHSERKARLKALRTDLSQKLVVGKEELYYVTIPVGSVHNHPLTGRSRNIHPSIISKVKELVLEGITSPKVIKRLLDTHIQMEHGNDVVTPHPDDRAYYPRMKDIGNLVYNYCKKMGIPSKGKNAGGQRVEGSAGKRKRHKSALSIGEYVECNDNKITDNLPLQASTLQEAVQTFCTDEPDRGNTVVSEQECASVNTVIQNTSSEVNSIAEIVRGQLDSLRNVTYTLNELGSLQDLCQSLQGLLNQYTPVNQQILQGGLGSNATPTAFIIHESVIDPLSVEDDHMQVGTVQESIQNSLTVPTRNAGCMVTTAKFRNSQVIENPHIRQFKPPVALQCLTTNMVPTLTMSQLPRSSSQSSEQGPAHLVTSIPSHSAANPTAVSITQPTYQTMAPITHDGSAVPVHLSLPPYFYYVQEVTVPDSSSTNSTLNGR